jgi:hypothetical protein
MVMALAAVSWCQDGTEPAKAEIPRDVWMPIVEVLVAGLVGATGALIGVLLAGRRNAAENAANRQQALEIERLKAETAAKCRTQDARWAFRRDVYVSLSNTITALREAGKTRRNLLKEHREVPESLQREMLSHFAQLKALASLAPLAISDSVLPSLRTVTTQAWGGEDCERAGEQLHALADLRRLVHEASRKDLWGAGEEGRERASLDAETQRRGGKRGEMKRAESGGNGGPPERRERTG